MDKELEEFAKKNRKRASVFDAYKKEIIYLVQQKVSQENIIVYLQKKTKLKTGLTRSNLSRYIARLKKQVRQKRELEQMNSETETKSSSLNNNINASNETASEDTVSVYGKIKQISKNKPFG
ncbi:hypothetical protein GCM10012288_24420 [Malaciobacter pacificus]|uniref:Uncharacterized protein n=1 Tax=Malaciobacter pacificus TaxID=1080223 RepID=A0A5C2H8A0_9BACT|nr:hypothetical protein [Malaciobacter pacificus]QEP35191.1 hypothetical protein APAC_2119 [Malaciobacter pacificus]GGD49444.1 hypothetical protein GCM10012288_24420 [Malaciobacter pacificus]